MATARPEILSVKDPHHSTANCLRAETSSFRQSNQLTSHRYRFPMSNQDNFHTPSNCGDTYESGRVHPGRAAVFAGVGTGPAGLAGFVPGFLLRPVDHATLLKRFESDEQFLGDDILPFLYDSGKWSNADPQVIARELATQIDEVWQRRRPKRLYIVAHSMGGLIARAALIHGIQLEQAWASNVTRLCLLESTNRGYRPQRWSHRFQLVLARAFGKARLARSMLVDSRFVLGVRLDWLNHFAVLSHVEKVEGGPDRTSPPETIQLLASPRARPVVLEDDSDDLLHCGNAEQRQIPHVNHYTIAMLADGASQEGGRYVPFEVIRSALFGPLRRPGSVQ